jgi:hypothetical protein
MSLQQSRLTSDETGGRFGAVALEVRDGRMLLSSWVKRVITTEPASAEKAVSSSLWLLARKRQPKEPLLCNLIMFAYVGFSPTSDMQVGCGRPRRSYAEG